MTAAPELDLAVFASIADRAEAPLAPALWEGIDVAGIAPERRALAQRSWAQRIEGEARALDFNRRFAALCAAADLPAEVQRAVARIARDEARHVELCTRIADAVGRPDDLVAPPGQRLPEPGAAVTPAELTRWTVTVFCLGEVCAASQVQALIDGQTDRGTRAALKLIFRDEAQHERFGWALAAALVPALSPDQREELGAALAHSLAFYEDLHGGPVPAASTALAPSAGHNGGVIDPGTFVRAFYATVEDELLPRLAALGVPAREAWALRAEARACWTGDQLPR